MAPIQHSQAITLPLRVRCRNESTPERTTNARPMKNNQQIPSDTRTKPIVNNARPTTNFVFGFFMHSFRPNDPSSATAGSDAPIANPDAIRLFAAAHG